MNHQVCLTFPSKRPVQEVAGRLLKAKQMGYAIAVWRDEADELIEVLQSAIRDWPIIVLMDHYPGYARAVNAICKEVLVRMPGVRYCVALNDDTDVDPNFTANEIADMIDARFGGSTFCVAQPTGCRWAGGSIDNIAGSPWMGREWCERAHQGAGPMCPLFFHMHVDDALLMAAEREGVYFRMPRVTQRHEHFCREGDEVNWGKAVPKHLEFANSPQGWKEAKLALAEFQRDYDRSYRPLPRQTP